MSDDTTGVETARYEGEGGAVAPEPPRSLGFFEVKHILDGAATLEDAAQQARAFGLYLEQLAFQGGELTEPVDDGFGRYRKAP